MGRNYFCATATFILVTFVARMAAAELVKTSVDFQSIEDSYSVMKLDIKINGKLRSCIVDTGSFISMVKSDDVEFSDYAPTGQLSGAGIGSQQKLYDTILDLRVVPLFHKILFVRIMTTYAM